MSEIKLTDDTIIGCKSCQWSGKMKNMKSQIDSAVYRSVQKMFMCYLHLRCPYCNLIHLMNISYFKEIK